MKVLMINKFLYPNGGSETYIFKLGDYLKSQGNEVEYFGMEHKDRCVGNRVNAYTSNMDFHGGSKLAKITYHDTSLKTNPTEAVATDPVPSGTENGSFTMDPTLPLTVTDPIETEPEETLDADGLIMETAPSYTDTAVFRDKNVINILLVGQASRAGDVERMADTMILATINKYEHTVTLTSFLRDSLVQPPNFRNKTFGKIKLTTVYHLGSFYDNGNIAGSMEFMNQTLYNNFGIEVDHNFEVDFDCFVKILDLILHQGYQRSDDQRYAF